MSGSERGGDYDGHGNELSMAVRVSTGASDSARSAAMVGSYPVEPWEQGIPRTVAGRVKDRVPRLKALGNAVVPQLVEAIGRAILAGIADRDCSP